MKTTLPEMSVEKIRDYILSEANNHALNSAKDCSSPLTEFRLRKELNDLRYLSKRKNDTLNKLKDAFEQLSKHQSPSRSLKGTTLNEIRLEFKSHSLEGASLLIEKLAERIFYYENTLTREIEQSQKLQYIKNREKKMAQAIHKKLDDLSSMYAKYTNLSLEAKITESTASLINLHEQFRSEYTDKQAKEEERARHSNITHLKNIDRRLKERILRAANTFARSVYQESQEYRYNSGLISKLEEAISQRQFFKESLENQKSQLKELEQEFSNLKDSIGVQTDIRDPTFMEQVTALWEDLKHSELLLQNRYSGLSKSYYKLTAELELLRTELDTANESVSIFNRFSLLRDRAQDIGLGVVTKNQLVQMNLPSRLSIRRIKNCEKLVMQNFSFLHIALLKIVKKLSIITTKAGDETDLMSRIQGIVSDTFMNSLRKKSEGFVRRVSVQKEKHSVIKNKDVSSTLLLADLAAPASIMGLKFSEILQNNAFLMTFIKRSSTNAVINRFRPVEGSNILDVMKEISEICSLNAQTKIKSLVSKTQEILTLIVKESASTDSEENKILGAKNELKMSKAKIYNLVKSIFSVKYQMMIKNKKLKKEDVVDTRFKILPLLIDRSPVDDNNNIEFKNRIKYSKTCEKLPPLVKSEDFKNNIKSSKSQINTLRNFGNKILLANHKFHE